MQDAAWAGADRPSPAAAVIRTAATRRTTYPGTVTGSAQPCEEEQPRGGLGRGAAPLVLLLVGDAVAASRPCGGRRRRRRSRRADRPAACPEAGPELELRDARRGVRGRPAAAARAESPGGEAGAVGVRLRAARTARRHRHSGPAARRASRARRSGSGGGRALVERYFQSWITTRDGDVVVGRALRAAGLLACGLPCRSRAGSSPCRTAASAGTSEPARPACRGRRGARGRRRPGRWRWRSRRSCWSGRRRPGSGREPGRWSGRGPPARDQVVPPKLRAPPPVVWANTRQLGDGAGEDVGETEGRVGRVVVDVLAHRGPDPLRRPAGGLPIATSAKPVSTVRP